MKYGFYISGKSSRLLKFLQQATIDDISSIKIVISDYKINESFKDLLTDYQIDCVVLNYLELDGSSNKEKNLILSDKIQKILMDYKIDYCFSLGSHLLGGELLENYKNRLINLHPAILPMFPGLKAVDQAAEKDNIFVVGNTAHFIDEGMDTGMIIMQSVIPLKLFLDTKDYDVILDMQVEMLNRLFKILNRDALRIENGRVVINGADYSKGYIFPDYNI